MARRPKVIEKSESIEVAPIRVVELESRVLATISPSHEYWVTKVIEPIVGAIYRVKPPAQASDEDVEKLVELMKVKGVASCNVLPRETAPAIVARKAAPAKVVSARQVVRDMVAEARTDDRAALSAACEEIMQEIGLQ